MGWTRREFLKKAGQALIALGAGGPLVLVRGESARTSAAAEALAGLGTPGGASSGDRVLVVVQLSGGNDGLDTVIPYGDGRYYDARPILALPAAEAVRLDGRLGLHPSLAPLKPLWDVGKLAVVQGVGYPHASRSHFLSMDVWHTADLSGRAPTGWLGRALDLLAGSPGALDPVLPAVAMGVALPRALSAGRTAAVCVEVLPRFRFFTPPRWRGEADAQLRAWEEMLGGDGTGDGSVPEPLAAVRRAGRVALAGAGAVERAALTYQPVVRYPASPFAQQLQAIARILTGTARTRVFYATLGSFDHHADEKARQARVLGTLAEALAAFYRDLEAHGQAQRVALLAFSEFGRRVHENASGGTDHGHAGPVLLLGGGVEGGFHGDHPSLSDLEDGDLRYGIDFRSVYASLLEDWLGVPAAEVLGGRFENLGLVRKAA